MALLDETGGKPLTGYGSGANSGAPVATPAEQAAALEAQAAALQEDFNGMCRNGGGYAFAGDFCRAVVDEALSMRYEATVLTHQGSVRSVVAPMAAVLWVGDRGAELAKATKKSASLLGGLRQRSRVGGKYLPVAGRTAKKLAPLAKASKPIAIVSVVIALPDPKAAVNAASQAVGGAAGVAVGGTVCGVIAIGSLGTGAAACFVAIPVGGAIGSYGAGWVFTKVAG
jgi:hypothetical protein